MRSVTFESESIVEAGAAEIARLTAEFPLLKGWADKMSASGGKTVYDPGLAVVNGTVLTNLGLFRAYMCEYILSRDEFNHDSQLLVRILDPLQIWCFTSTTAFTAYEAIQSALFEHIAVVAPKFGLKIYNTTSVLDTTTVQMLPDAP